MDCVRCQEENDFNWQVCMECTTPLENYGTTVISYIDEAGTYRENVAIRVNGGGYLIAHLGLTLRADQIIADEL